MPLVRGSAFMTHRFENANPMLLPYCLSAVDGQAIGGIECPAEMDGMVALVEPLIAVISVFVATVD